MILSSYNANIMDVDDPVINIPRPSTHMLAFWEDSFDLYNETWS